MGYITKNIAKITEPNVVTLSDNPNYVIFESLTSGFEPSFISLKVVNTSVTIDKTKFTIVETLTGNRYEYSGTTNPKSINDETFFLNSDRAITIENIRYCLMQNSFFRSNFEITVPPVNENGSLVNGDTAYIKSLGGGVNYSYRVEGLSAEFLRIVGNSQATSVNDSIDQGLGNCEIELEIYADTGVRFGENDIIQNGIGIGIYRTTLSKSYYHKPIWFNINSVIDPIIVPEFLEGGWLSKNNSFTNFRFIARRNDAISSDAFYVSNVLWCVKGYTRDLNSNNLDEYVYDGIKLVKPLTNQPTLYHIRGQKQLFNFLFKKPSIPKNICILYRVYTQSMKMIAELPVNNVSSDAFYFSNTINLNLDYVLDLYPNAGYIEAYLANGVIPASDPLCFKILPECLHKVKDFAFLNSLGGWSTFNFGGIDSSEFKTNTNTIYKTQTPYSNISSDIESVKNKEVEEHFTVQTMPITREICNWLKELSTSPAVYEMETKRYIIVDDLNIKSNSKDELFRLEMKYHYSDKYNAKLF